MNLKICVHEIENETDVRPLTEYVEKLEQINYK